MSIVDFAELQRISGLSQKAAVRRYLKRLRISFLVGADGAPWTTIAALNRVLLSDDGPAKRWVRSADGRTMVGATDVNIEACHRTAKGRSQKSVAVDPERDWTKKELFRRR